MNIYAHSEKVFKAAMESEYHSYRRGAFDFPTEEEWLEDMWKTFVANNPELVGLKWDEENKDWVHQYPAGMVRVILKTQKP